MLLRPQMHLAKVPLIYDGFWRVVDTLREPRVSTGERIRWPEWCFLPTVLVSELLAARLGPEALLSGDAAVLSGLAAWRVSQGIYRFAPEVLDALWETPIEGQLPAELLYRLPEWCVYVETPGKVLDGHPLHGFFAFVDTFRDGKDQVVFLLDLDELLNPVPLLLLADGLEATITCIVKGNSITKGAPWPETDKDNDTARQELRSSIAPLLSVVLYLCSTAPRSATPQAAPGNPIALGPSGPNGARDGFRRIGRRPGMWHIGSEPRCGSRRHSRQRRTTELMPARARTSGVRTGTPSGRGRSPSRGAAGWSCGGCLRSLSRSTTPKSSCPSFTRFPASRSPTLSTHPMTTTSRAEMPLRSRRRETPKGRVERDGIQCRSADSFCLVPAG